MGRQYRNSHPRGSCIRNPAPMRTGSWARHGFIVMTEPGCLGVAGRGKAPHWRLTELGCMAEPPTRDFMRWDGTVFQEQKKSRRPARQKQNPVPSDGPGCTAGRDITAYRRTDQSADQLCRQAVHTDDGSCTVQRDISRVNHSPHLEWTTSVDGSAAVAHVCREEMATPDLDPVLRRGK